MKMLKTVLNNLVHKNSTRNYPACKRDDVAGYRGEIENDISRCILCKMCEKKCPVGCIKVDRDKKTWEYNPLACIYCGLCVEACPVKCLKQKENYLKPVYKKEIVLQVKEESSVKEDKQPVAVKAEASKAGEGKSVATANKAKGSNSQAEKSKAKASGKVTKASVKTVKKDVKKSKPSIKKTGKAKQSSGNPTD